MKFERHFHGDFGIKSIVEPFEPLISFIGAVDRCGVSRTTGLQNFSWEALMWSKLFTAAILGMGTAGFTLVGGCSSSNEKPNAVTGQDTGVQDPAAYDAFGKYHPEWVGHPERNPRYIDQKGHYHPEWVNAANH